MSVWESGLVQGGMDGTMEGRTGGTMQGRMEKRWRDGIMHALGHCAQAVSNAVNGGKAESKLSGSCQEQGGGHAVSSFIWLLLNYRLRHSFEHRFLRSLVIENMLELEIETVLLCRFIQFGRSKLASALRGKEGSQKPITANNGFFSISSPSHARKLKEELGMMTAHLCLLSKPSLFGQHL